MSTDRTDRTPWAILAGGVTVAVGSQFAWVASFTGWIGYAPLTTGSSSPQGGLGLATIPALDVSRYREVLVACSIGLVGCAVALLSSKSRRRAPRAACLALASILAVVVAFVWLQVVRFFHDVPLPVHLSSFKSGLWCITAGAIVCIASSAWLALPLPPLRRSLGDQTSRRADGTVRHEDD